MQNELIFLPKNIPSLKNSKVMGRFPSKTVMNWLRYYGIQSYNSGRKEVKFFKKIPKQANFEELCKSIKEHRIYPIKLGFHFVRGSRHKWDFHNPCHLVLDLMTAFDIIPDDNVECILPFPLEIDNNYWSYDKDTPGVYIKIIN